MLTETCPAFAFVFVVFIVRGSLILWIHKYSYLKYKRDQWEVSLYTGFSED